MSSQRLTYLLAPLLFLYLLAEVGTSAVAFDGTGRAIAALGLGLASLPLLALRARGTRGERRVSLLVLASAFSLLGFAMPSARSVFVEIAWAWCGPLAAALALDLAADVPDAPRALSRARVRAFAVVLGAAVAALGSAVALPLETLLGPRMLVSNAYRPWCTLGLFALLGLAAAMRARRRLHDSTAEARASNAWALLGLVAASLAMLVHAWSLRAHDDAALRASWSLGAMCLSFGHVWMLDERRRLALEGVLRELAASALVVALVAAAGAALGVRLGASARASALLASGSASLALVGVASLRRSMRWLFAPMRGALLSAIDRACSELSRAVHPLDVARAVLAPLDAVASLDEQRSVIVTFDPDHAFETDRAGEPHDRKRSFSSAIREQLERAPADMILREALEPRLVRHPEERPLYQAMIAIDALVVVPLRFEDALEGALVIAKGERKERLSLEELHRLEQLARALAARVAILSSNERLRARAEQAERRLASPAR